MQKFLCAKDIIPVTDFKRNAIRICTATVTVQFWKRGNRFILELCSVLISPRLLRKTFSVLLELWMRDIKIFGADGVSGISRKSPSPYTKRKLKGKRDEGIERSYSPPSDVEPSCLRGQNSALKKETALHVYSSGDRYQGNFADGKRHGIGKYVWSIGDVYTGNWNRGLMNGIGTMKWASGAQSFTCIRFCCNF